MPWKNCVLPLGEDCSRIRDGFSLLAAASGDAPEVALFSRTTLDRQRHILLMSPLAVELAGDALSPRWEVCEAPQLFEWDLLLGDVGAHERLGLCTPKFGRARASVPAFMIGAAPTPDLSGPAA